MKEHLVLPLEPTNTYTRESFRVGVNEHLFPTLFQSTDFWLYGAPAVGKTHAMHILVAELESAVLVSDADYELNGLEVFSTVVIDGIEQWVGNREREKSILGLYENSSRLHHHLVLTSRSKLETIGFTLPDLKSRISMFHRYHLLPLPHREQLDFLQELVSRNGTKLRQEVGQFILRHLTRSQAGLVEAVIRLNQESIYRNRSISIGLVKDVFGI